MPHFSRVNPYIFRAILIIFASGRHFNPISKIGLGKTARGQMPNPHPQAHPPRSF